MKKILFSKVLYVELSTDIYASVPASGKFGNHKVTFGDQGVVRENDPFIHSTFHIRQSFISLKWFKKNQLAIQRPFLHDSL